MWLDKLVQSQDDPWLLRWNLTETDFLDRGLAPAYLYYNPAVSEKHIEIETAGRVRDISQNRVLRAQRGKVDLLLRSQEAVVVELLQ